MEDTNAQRPTHAAAASRLLTIALFASAAGLSACGQGGDQTGKPAASSSPASSASASPSPPASLAAANAAFAAAQTQAMLQALTQAPQQGFAPAAFGDVQQMASLVASTDQAQQAQGQKLLRAAIIKYARAQHGLGLPTDQFPKEWGIRPARYDADTDLRAAQGANRIADWLKSLPPQAPRYQALVQALRSVSAS